MFLVINGLEWFSKGGWAMYPLALISLYTVFVILNRLYFFSRFIPETDNELENVLRGTALGSISRLKPGSPQSALGSMAKQRRDACRVT